LPVSDGSHTPRLRRELLREQRRARLFLWTTIGITILLLLFAGFAFLQMQAILAWGAAHPPFNGVTCDTMEQGGYLIHAHERWHHPRGVGHVVGALWASKRLSSWHRQDALKGRQKEVASASISERAVAQGEEGARGLLER